MTSAKLRYFISFFIYVLVGALIILLQSTGFMTLQISTASAVLILPLTVYAGFYFGEYAGAVYGLMMGALTDVYSSTLFYNAVALTVVGFAAGLLIARLFNRNLAAASVISSGASAVYFFIKWLVLYAFTDPVPMFVLVRFTLPSLVYTAVLGILIYFPLDLFLKKIPKRVTKQ